MKPAFTSAAYALAFPTFNPASNRWEMADSRVERMQCLFETEAAALEFKRVSLAHLESREKWEIEHAAAVAKAAADRAAYLASFGGWLSTDPMCAGRQLQTMERKFLWRGEARTRKQIVDTMIAEGRTLTENGLEDASGTEHATGAFLAIGKTERSYAAHVLAARAAATLATVAA